MFKYVKCKVKPLKGTVVLHMGVFEPGKTLPAGCFFRIGQHLKVVYMIIKKVKLSAHNFFSSQNRT